MAEKLRKKKKIFPKVLNTCFICDKPKYYKLSCGVKSIEKIDQISFLLKIDFKAVVENNTRLGLGLCRSCYVKIFNSFEFVKLLEAGFKAANQHCSGDHSNDPCVFQRVAVTPKLAKPYSAPEKRVSTLRKSLIIPKTEEQEQPEPNSVDALDMPSSIPLYEHSYSATSNTPMTTTENSGFKLLKKHLGELEDVGEQSVITAILNTIKSSSVLRKAVENCLMNEMNIEPTSLSSSQVRVKKEASSLDNLDDSETSEGNKGNDNDLGQISPIDDNIDVMEDEDKGDNNDLDQEFSHFMCDQNDLSGVDKDGENIVTTDESEQLLKEDTILETNKKSLNHESNLRGTSSQVPPTDSMHARGNDKQRAADTNNILDDWQNQTEQERNRIDRKQENQKELCRSESHNNDEENIDETLGTGEQLPYKSDLSHPEISNKDDKDDLARNKIVHTGENQHTGNFSGQALNGSSSSDTHQNSTGKKLKNMYICDLCGYATDQVTNIKMHVGKHNGVKPYKCDVCGHEFLYRHQLTRHERKHTGEKPYKCEMCGYAFAAKRGLTRHKTVHSGEKPYKCDLCGCTFRERVGLKKHTRIHTGEKPFKCQICGQAFRDLSYKIKHQRIVHSGQKPYSCDVCERAFAEKRNLIKHQRIHTGEKPYQCDVCGHAFRNISGLTNHKRRHTGGQPCQCDVCGRFYRSSIGLAKHKKRLTCEKPNKGEKAYKCDLCDRAFSDESGLSRHKKKHTSEKQYICDVCGYGSNWASDLTKHKRIHTGEKPYKCDVCGSAFICSRYLAIHKRKHTGEKPYLCGMCGRAFRERRDLTKHERIHSGEKPYSCDECGRAFRVKSDLTRHKRIHTGEKPYKCDICGIAFSCSSSLTKHKRKHTLEEPYLDFLFADVQS